MPAELSRAVHKPASMAVHASALTRNTMRQPYGTTGETRGTTEFGSFMALSLTRYLGHVKQTRRHVLGATIYGAIRHHGDAARLLLPSSKLPFACLTITFRRQPEDETGG
jgi:hypothetical protein